MARKKTPGGDNGGEDFTADLITSLNKEHGTRIAYNLATDLSPTHVKRWVSTGSEQLDFICSNRPKGGLPEGRIIEIFGPPSIGKSHLAVQIARSTQAAGGIVVYIDTENGTSVENLMALGVDITKKFVYIDTHCTEEVFAVMEKTIQKVKAMSSDVPITIIWDSVAGSSPKAELLGDYDKDTIGLQARTISKGMRKITGVIGDTSTTLICLNQVRTKIGVLYGDPDTTPGGKALPFHASVRIKLGAGSPIKNKDGDVVGINVSAKTVKNKVASPFRTVHFEIHFGRGIFEHEQLFDVLRKHGPVTVNGLVHEIAGSGSWKQLLVTDEATGEVIVDKKFYKANFNEVRHDPEFAGYIDPIVADAFSKRLVSSEHVDIDAESYEEIRSLADDVMDLGESLEI